MTLKEVEISEIKNLNLIYIFTTDDILRGQSETYIGAKVVFDKNRTYALDYRDPYFEQFLRRIIDRYHKEKDRQHIILLGDLTKKIIHDECFKTKENIPTQKTVGISMFNTKNYALKKYESYLIEALEHILKTLGGYTAVKVTKIDGYNNKYVVYYEIGSVYLETRILISLRDDNHLDFKVGEINQHLANVTGTITNDISQVEVTYEGTSGVNGSIYYDSLTNTSEKRINSKDKTIFYQETSETIIPEDEALLTFYCNLFNIPILPNIIKTSDHNYLSGSEEIKNNNQYEIISVRKCVQIIIEDDLVIIRYQVVDGISKYNKQLSITLAKDLYEITLSKIVVDHENYILIEQKKTNDFGSTYDYRVFKVDNLDFKCPFSIEKEYVIDTDINSLEDIKSYVKRRKEGNK